MAEQIEFEGIGSRELTPDELLAESGRLLGERFERVVIVAMNDRGIRIASVGQAYQTDIPGLLTAARQLVESDLLRRCSIVVADLSTGVRSAERADEV